MCTVYDFIKFLSSTHGGERFLLFYREYHQCEREKQICISCWFGSVIDYNMFILTGHFSELDYSAYCSYSKELLYFDVVLQLKEKECTVFFVHLDFILAEKKYHSFRRICRQIQMFSIYPPKHLICLYTKKILISGCLRR